MIKGLVVSFTDEEKKKILENVAAVLDSGYLMDGMMQHILDERFRAETGKDYAVLFNSATSSFEALFKSLKCDVVAYQANCFPSVIFAGNRAGCSARVVDIDPVQMMPTLKNLDDTWNRGEFGALVIQDDYGFICDWIGDIVEWCRDRNVTLIEDAARALGSSLDGENAGSFGDYSVFCLSGTKPLNAGRGGCVVCDNSRVADDLFMYRNYGKPVKDMFAGGQCTEEGYSIHFDELRAAVACVTFDTLGRHIAHKRIIAGMYTSSGFPPLGGTKCLANWYKYPVKVDVEKYGGRDEITSAMKVLGVELARPVSEIPAFHEPVFAGRVRDKLFPGTIEFCYNHICLPMHNSITFNEAKMVIEALRKALS